MPPSRTTSAEQAQLGAQVVLEVRVIIHVVAGDVGEAAGRDLHAIETELVEAMAGGFQRQMVDAVLLQLRQQAVDFDRIRRGVLERDLAVRRHDADGAEAGGRHAQRGPDLAHEGDDGGFALGAGDGGDGLGLGAEEARGLTRQAEARIVVGDEAHAQRFAAAATSGRPSTATAPRATASFTNSAPSAFVPGSAANR